MEGANIGLHTLAAIPCGLTLIVPVVVFVLLIRRFQMGANNGIPGIGAQCQMMYNELEASADRNPLGPVYAKPKWNDPTTWKPGTFDPEWQRNWSQETLSAWRRNFGK